MGTASMKGMIETRERLHFVLGYDLFTWKSQEWILFSFIYF